MKTLKNTSLFFALGLGLLAAGIFLFLFVSIPLGAAVLLASEMILFLPKWMVRNAVKKENAAADKKTLKKLQKEADKELRRQNALYRLCTIFAYVSGVAGMIAFFFWRP